MSIPDRIAARQLSAPPQHSLALASRGDALTPYLLNSLEKRFSAVGLIDPELTILQRYRVAALTVRPNRGTWVERFYKSGYARQLRSANAARSMRSLLTKPDLVLQVHALFAQPDSATVLYIDCTHAQSAELWPAWNPLRGSALRSWYQKERETYAAATHLFAFSEATRQSLIVEYGLDAEKVTVTGAGVNFERLPELARRGHRPTEEPPTILFIGNDFVRKGGAVLLEAFHRVRAVVPEARLQLVGVEPGIHSQPGVEILGRISDRDRVASLYEGAAVFVVPSFFDPYPLVALEAMSFGLPVIATNQMGTPEMIVDGRTGRLVEPGNVDALSAALLQLLLDPNGARQLGAAARHEVEMKFTWDAVVDRMSPVLERLLSEVSG